MRRHLLLIFGMILLVQSVYAIRDDIRSNVLINGSKYVYQSVVEIGDGKYIPLFGMGLMIVPQGQVPPGLLGSAAAIFSSGYQAKAKLAQTGPQEVFVAKHVRKSLGPRGSGIAAQTFDISKLKPPLSEQ